MTTTDSPLARDQKILIFGSLIIDEYIFVDTKKLSPEAPVPVAYLKSSKTVKTPGAAGLAAAYARKHSILSTLLTDCTLESEDILRTEYLLNVENFSYSANDIKKIRYIDNTSKYHMLRVDNDLLVGRYSYLLDEISPLFETCLEDSACLLILDYNKGLFVNQDIAHYILSYSKSKNIPVYVDSRADTRKFIGASVLKMNMREYEAACNNISIPPALGTSLERLREAYGLEALIVSKGPEGAILRTTDKTIACPPNVQYLSSIPDVTGCGDILDINFCYYYYVLRQSVEEALQNAVNAATLYAFEPVDKRLKCQTSKKE